MDAAGARRRLIRQLQGAYSGERAAAFAYRGHWNTLEEGADRTRIREIEAEEWHHRELVAGLLRELGASPRPRRELLFFAIGRVLGVLCHLSGWFLPMYGAGFLERHNIVEYEDAATFAVIAGHHQMVDCILTMAEVEWEHEAYFRERTSSHALAKWIPLWSAPPAKSSIRAAHAQLTGETVTV